MYVAAESFRLNRHQCKEPQNNSKIFKLSIHNSSKGKTVNVARKIKGKWKDAFKQKPWNRNERRRQFRREEVMAGVEEGVGNIIQYIIICEH